VRGDTPRRACWRSADWFSRAGARARPCRAWGSLRASTRLRDCGACGAAGLSGLRSSCNRRSSGTGLPCPPGGQTGSESRRHALDNGIRRACRARFRRASRRYPWRGPQRLAGDGPWESSCGFDGFRSWVPPEKLNRRATGILSSEAAIAAIVRVVAEGFSCNDPRRGRRSHAGERRSTSGADDVRLRRGSCGSADTAPRGCASAGR
jgi:hypothetical protein